MNHEALLRKLEAVAKKPGSRTWEEIRSHAIAGFRGHIAEWTGFDASTWSERDVMVAIRKLIGLDNPETRDSIRKMIKERCQ